MKKYFLILIMMFSVVSAQQTDPNEIIKKVKEKIDAVVDYEVEAVIKIDVNFLRVPETHATIFFKKPDKIKMESTGFALMPKQGLNFSPATLLQHDYTAILAKEDQINGNDVYLIKILPLSDSTEVILSNLWVDKNKFIVYKIETTTKNSGTVGIDLSYADNIDYGLPSKIVISFRVEQMNLPPGMDGEFEKNDENKKRGPMTGTVTVTYKNYKINQGLKDEFFDEADEVESPK